MNVSGDLRLGQGAEPGVTALPQGRVERWLLTMIMVTVTSVCLSCGPGGRDPSPTLTPQERELQVADLFSRLEARLLEAEQKGIVNPGEKGSTLALWRQTKPPALVGYITAISADSLSIRTFVSADEQDYFAGDPWTFKFTPETRVRRWLAVFISPQDLKKDEIVRVILVDGTMNLQAVVGLGVPWP
jgi:hypothetical protein